MSGETQGQESDRKGMTFRLTAEGRRLLELLARRKGVNKTAVIELLLRDEARREGVGD